MGNFTLRQAGATGRIIYPSMNLGIQSPTPIAWLAADAIAGLADGASLAAWLDQSGNGYNVTATGSAQPVYKVSIQNGLPVVRFNGSTSYMASAAFVLNQPTSLFVVGNCTDVAGTDYFCDALSSPTDNRSLRLNAGTNFQAGSNGGGSFLSQTISSLAPYALMDAIYNGASSLLGFNGTTTTGTLAEHSGGDSGYEIGARDGANDFLAGNIGEVVLYSSALTTAQRQFTEGYLAWKWGLQALLPSNHPYFSSPPGTSFTFNYPREFPAFHAMRKGGADTVSGSGLQQSMTQFIDTEFDFGIPFVPASQASAWFSFSQSALQRVPFDFFPDATKGLYLTCLLVDDAFSLPYKSPGEYELQKMTFRVLITGAGAWNV